MKREILDHLPVDEEEGEGEKDEQLQGEDDGDAEMQVNGHTENGNDDLNGGKASSVDDEMVADVVVKPEAAPLAKAH